MPLSVRTSLPLLLCRPLASRPVAVVVVAAAGAAGCSVVGSWAILDASDPLCDDEVEEEREVEVEVLLEVFVGVLEVARPPYLHLFFLLVADVLVDVLVDVLSDSCLCSLFSRNAFATLRRPGSNINCCCNIFRRQELRSINLSCFCLLFLKIVFTHRPW